MDGMQPCVSGLRIYIYECVCVDVCVGVCVYSMRLSFYSSSDGLLTSI